MSKVLLVDDSPILKKMVAHLFQNYNPAIEVICASTCKESLDIINSTEIDCVFLDQRLENHENGIDCLQQMRHSRYPGSIIIFTGYLEEKVVSEAMKLGADDFVLKNTGVGTAMVQAYEAAMIRRTQVGLARAKHERVQLKLNQLSYQLDEVMRDLKEILAAKEKEQHGN